MLVYVRLTWAPLTTFQIALPTTAHTRYKVRFRPHFRAKTAPISSSSHLCRIAFESVILNEFLDFGDISRAKISFFKFFVASRLCVGFIYRLNTVILPFFSRQNSCYHHNSFPMTPPLSTFFVKKKGGSYRAFEYRFLWNKLLFSNGGHIFQHIAQHYHFTYATFG